MLVDSTYNCSVRSMPHKGVHDDRRTVQAIDGDRIVFCNDMLSWDLQRKGANGRWLHVAYVFGSISQVTRGDEVL